MSDNTITCWHKEIAEDGICKNCGARAAIKLNKAPAVSQAAREWLDQQDDRFGCIKRAEQVCNVVRLLESYHAQASAGLRAEHKLLGYSWDALLVELAKFDPEFADAPKEAILEEFDPWNCVRGLRAERDEAREAAKTLLADGQKHIDSLKATLDKVGAELSEALSTINALRLRQNELVRERDEITRQLEERKKKAENCCCDAAYDVDWLKSVLEQMGIVRREIPNDNGIREFQYHNERAEKAESELSALRAQLDRVLSVWDEDDGYIKMQTEDAADFETPFGKFYDAVEALRSKEGK